MSLKGNMSECLAELFYHGQGVKSRSLASRNDNGVGPAGKEGFLTAQTPFGMTSDYTAWRDGVEPFAAQDKRCWTPTRATELVFAFEDEIG